MLKYKIEKTYKKHTASIILIFCKNFKLLLIEISIKDNIKIDNY